jgi:hypothetical protein
MLAQVMRHPQRASRRGAACADPHARAGYPRSQSHINRRLVFGYAQQSKNEY